ncbi:MAG: ECF-type sigma factor [Labilithrix sp.]
MGDVTAVLQRLEAGERSAISELLPLVYGELRELAAARMRRLPPGQTLQPTALVHEAFLKLTDGRAVGFQGRGHFFGAAALAMRDILVDAARRKGAQKRGAGEVLLELDETIVARSAAVGTEDMIALAQALDRLREAHPRQAEVVMLKTFAGLSEAEIAEMNQITVRTVERDQRFAQAFLLRELSR